MEQHDSFFPKYPNRRWILAQLLSLPPALMELVTEEPSEPSDEHKKLLVVSSTKALDTEEYYKTLKSYWVDGYTRGKLYAIKDTKRRIAKLQQQVFYPSSTQTLKQKQKTARLLCGY